jgi:hypothetical protein
MDVIRRIDPEMAHAIALETERRNHTLDLIASENLISPAVMATQTSVLTNKYAEGYPGRRYYGGCANADTIEKLAITRATRLFYASYANVQPHSGTQANMAVSGNPVFYIVNFITNEAERFFCLIYSGSTEQYDSIIKDNTIRFDVIGFYDGLSGTGFNTAHEQCVFLLPQIKPFMALVPSIHNTGVSRRQDLTNKGPFSPVAFGEKDLSGNTAV